MEVTDPPTTDLYASLVANVTQASMLVMLLYLASLKLPLGYFKHLVASGSGHRSQCSSSKSKAKAGCWHNMPSKATNQLPSQLAIQQRVGVWMRHFPWRHYKHTTDTACQGFHNSAQNQPLASAWPPSWWLRNYPWGHLRAIDCGANLSQTHSSIYTTYYVACCWCVRPEYFKYWQDSTGSGLCWTGFELPGKSSCTHSNPST